MENGTRVHKEINQVLNHITHLDKTLIEYHQTLVNTASSNASIVMSSFESIGKLMKESDIVKKDNDEYKKKQVKKKCCKGQNTY